MNNTKIITICAVLAILGLGGYIVLHKYSTKVPEYEMIDDYAHQTKIFYWDNPSTLAKVGQPFSVFLKANAGMSDVTGYDIVVQYDPQFGFLQKNTVLSPNFDAYVREEAGLVSVTAIKKMAIQTSVSLADERMIELSFMPAKTGSYVFKVVPQHDKAKTKIVDSKSNIISQDVEDQFTINVQ